MSLKNHCYRQLKQTLPQAQPLAVSCLGIPEEQEDRKTESAQLSDRFSQQVFPCLSSKGCDFILSHYPRAHSKAEAGDITLTFSDAVAILVPCRFKAMQLKTPS